MASIHKIRQVQLVGRKIRELRKGNRLTQTDLAARIGIQQSDLSRMEKGEYRVSLDTLFRILAEFDVGIGEFFDAVSRDALTPRDIQFVTDLNALPTEARREIYDLVSHKRAESLEDQL